MFDCKPKFARRNDVQKLANVKVEVGLKQRVKAGVKRSTLCQPSAFSSFISMLLPTDYFERC